MTDVHLLFSLLFVFSFAVSEQAAATSSGIEEPTMTVLSRLKDAQLVPDVIDEISDEVVTVAYPSGAKVDFGNELTPTSVKDQPTVTWPADRDALYTLIMADPDAPSRADPKFREVRHWMVVNIPGTDVAKGNTIVDYIGSGPPEGTGLHRYAFLVYKQSAKLVYDEEFTPNTSRKHRLSSSARAFATKYNLGHPIAGNYYLAQFDDYVPTLHARFTE